MKPVVGPLLDETVRQVVRSKWRMPILRRLLVLDNFMDRWVSTFSMEKGLHPKHRLIQYHRFFVDNVAVEDRVLDVGCGNGYLAFDVAAKAKIVVGIDFDEKNLTVARQKYHRDNLSYILGDATTYPFSQQFDVVLLSNVLEHIEDRVSLLKKIARLSPKLLIRVPMLNRDWLPLLKREIGVEYRLDPTHTIEYTEEIFREEMAVAGLTVVSLAVRFGEIYSVVSK